MKPTKLEGDLLAVSDEIAQTVIWNWRTQTSAILKQPEGEAGIWQVSVFFEFRLSFLTSFHSPTGLSRLFLHTIAS